MLLVYTEVVNARLHVLTGADNHLCKRCLKNEIMTVVQIVLAINFGPLYNFLYQMSHESA